MYRLAPLGQPICQSDQLVSGPVLASGEPREALGLEYP